MCLSTMQIVKTINGSSKLTNNYFEFALLLRYILTNYELYVYVTRRVTFGPNAQMTLQSKMTLK